MSPPFRINHLSGQRVRVIGNSPGNQCGEIVSTLYEGDRIVAFKVRLDSSFWVVRYPASSCLVLLPRIEDA